MAFKITKKHHKHLNNPFPSPPKSIPFIQGALSLNLQALPSHQIYSIGHDFQLNWSAKNGGFLSISHKSQPARHAWSTIPGEAFISAAAVETEVVESRGSFVIKDKDVHLICNHQTIDDIRVINESDLPSEAKDHDFPSLSDKRNGHFPLLRSFSHKFGLINRCRVRWSRLLPRKKGTVTVSSTEEEKVTMRTAGSQYFNRIFLTYSSEKNERFYGFGEQFSQLDFKGKRVPIFVQEQGIGRGDQPITFAANLVSYRAGGDWSTTYAPSPFYMTSKMRSLYLEGYNYSVFDLTKHDRVQIQVNGDSLEGQILHGDSPCELIEHLTESIGRPPELPEWIISGAVVGMQGGTDTVRSIWNEMQRHGVPVSAFWLQVQNPPFFKYTRSEELLLRWMELNAFTTIFRTHEGNKPSSNTQFYSNNRTLSHFARFAKVYKAWKFYRIQLVKEASQKGLPVCRHLFLHYQDDDRVHSLTYEQFLIGSEILVVPVLDKGKETVKAYFPIGECSSWKHIWTGKLYSKQGYEAMVEAPIGYPAIFVKDGSAVGETFLENLKNDGIL